MGMDISDRSCHVIALSQEDGELVWEQKVATRAAALQKFFSPVADSRIALEVETHSGWISRFLSSLGHEAVWVANARLGVNWPMHAKLRADSLYDPFYQSHRQAA